MKTFKFLKHVWKISSPIIQFFILPVSVFLWIVSAFVLAEPWIVGLIQQISAFFDWIIEFLGRVFDLIIEWKRSVALFLSFIGGILLVTGSLIGNSRYTQQGRNLILALATTSCAAGIAIWTAHGLPDTNQNLLQELFRLQSLFLVAYVLLWLIHFFVKREVSSVGQLSPYDHVRLFVSRLTTRVKDNE